MRSLDDIRATLEATTPGPWEAGHVWLRAGVLRKDGSCAACWRDKPAFIDPAMNVNGTVMVGHVHRIEDPYDPEHSISGADYTEVLQGHGECGPNISEADATFIRHARQDVPDLLAAIKPLAEFARWLVSLDDPDPAGVGRRDRQTVNLTKIIERARVALGQDATS